MSQSLSEYLKQNRTSDAAYTVYADRFPDSYYVASESNRSEQELLAELQKRINYGEHPKFAVYHLNADYQEEKIAKELGIDEEQVLVSCIPVTYPDNHIDVAFHVFIYDKEEGWHSIPEPERLSLDSIIMPDELIATMQQIDREYAENEGKTSFQGKLYVVDNNIDPNRKFEMEPSLVTQFIPGFADLVQEAMDCKAKEITICLETKAGKFLNPERFYFMNAKFENAQIDVSANGTEAVFDNKDNLLKCNIYDKYGTHVNNTGFRPKEEALDKIRECSTLVPELHKDKTFFVEYALPQPILPSLLIDGKYTEKDGMFECSGYISQFYPIDFEKELKQMAADAGVKDSFEVKRIRGDEYAQKIPAMEKYLEENAVNMSTAEYKQLQAQIKQAKHDACERFPDSDYAKSIRESLEKDSRTDDKDVNTK